MTDAFAALAVRFAGEPLEHFERFTNGFTHRTFDVRTRSGRAFVLRIADPEGRDTLVGAARWSAVLRPRGVPLPALLHDGTSEPVPHLILERLPGTDLRDVCTALTPDQKREVAREVARLQSVVAGLPRGRGFGFSGDPERAAPHGCWADVLRASLARSRGRLESTRAFDTARVDRVAAAVEAAAPGLASIPATAFLDDTTTKNVLVHEGRLSGVVDVDFVCFGDPLFAPALTWTSLVGAGVDTGYVRAWCEAAGVTTDAMARLRLYARVFVVDFFSEVGLRFNRDRPVSASAERLERLRAFDHELELGTAVPEIA